MTSLSRYPEVVELAANNRAPQHLVHYLRDLANDFHTYYNAHAFIVDETDLREMLSESLEQLRALENGMTVAVVLTDTHTVSVDRPEDAERFVAGFRGIEAPLGVYGILGNHDTIRMVPALETLASSMSSILAFWFQRSVPMSKPLTSFRSTWMKRGSTGSATLSSSVVTKPSPSGVFTRRASATGVLIGATAATAAPTASCTARRRSPASTVG